MKKILKCLLFIGLLGLWAPASFGQISGKVYYKSILEIQKFEPLAGITVFKGDKSSFNFLKQAKSSSNTETSVSQVDPYNINMEVNMGEPLASYLEVFIDRDEKEIISRENYFKNGKSHPCLTVEPSNPMKWEITGEKKTIDAFEAIKARTNFRGRSYTAWFTTDIPIDIGPWKFHGLPGLILEVYDDEKGVQFYMSSVEIPAKLNEVINPPTAPEQLTIQEYAEYEQDLSKELIELLQSKLPRGIAVGNIDVKKGKDLGIEREYNFATSKTNQ